MMNTLGICRAGRGLVLGYLLLGASVQAITLGSTTVPKEKMIVYLLIGHSNMAGVDMANSDDVTTPKAWNYEWNGTKTWVMAKEPKNNSKGGLSTHGAGGPGMPFLKGMTTAFPDYYFGVINNASVSSTCRGENTGNNNSGLDPSDNRYWKDSYLYVQILTAAKAIQKDVTFGGILCMLGTVDATRTNEAVCRAFSDDISQLAKDLRADLGEPNLPFIMGEYEAGAKGTFATTLLMPGIIADQVKLIPGKLANSATVSTDGIALLDDHHFAAKVGQVEWAKRAVAIFQSKAWVPPPAGTAALNARQAGNGSSQGKSMLLSRQDAKLIWKDNSLYYINGEKVPNLKIGAGQKAGHPADGITALKL